MVSQPTSCAGKRASRGHLFCQHRQQLQPVLAYDRPDIILLDGVEPVLVVEETVEVPSGHNVGQRFARIAASAEAGVPFLYFGPYVAKKHGGITAGPRYMNLRLFYALDNVNKMTGTAITTINWPADDDFEVRRDSAKDSDVRDYLDTFMQLYLDDPGLESLNHRLVISETHNRLIADRTRFVESSIRRPEQYDRPPNTVEIMTSHEFNTKHGALLRDSGEVVLYRIGMSAIRSDPCTGMAMLYRYLYVERTIPERALVLWFPTLTGGRRQSRGRLTLRRSTSDTRTPLIRSLNGNSDPAPSIAGP